MGSAAWASKRRALSSGSLLLLLFFFFFFFFSCFCALSSAFSISIEEAAESSSSSSSGSGSGSGSFDMFQHLSTMTPYVPQQLSYPPPPDGCYPVYYNLVARHGSRQPTSVSGYVSLQQNLEAVADYITNPAFAWMKNWTSPFNGDFVGELDNAGVYEHYFFGARNRDNYPTLLNESFSSHYYDIQSTMVVRTAVSAAAHMYGLFEGKGVLNGYDAAGSYSLGPADYLLRFFDVCPLYLQIQDSPAASEQTTLYEPVVASIGPQIMETLNLTAEQWNITFKDVQHMWSACGYELSVFNRTDQWCLLFNESQVDILEFYDDLDTYYSHGPGFPVNYQSATLLLQDFYQHFVAVINGSDTLQKARLRFGHAETIMPFVSLLGLYIDSQPLTYNATWAPKRQWKSSQITPFTANLAMVLYNCTELDGTFKVKALHNEEEIQLPVCSDLYCDFDEFKQGYQVELSYNFTEICAIPETPTPTPPSTPTPTPTTPTPRASPTPQKSGGDSSQSGSGSGSGSEGRKTDHDEPSFSLPQLIGAALGGLFLGIVVVSLLFVVFIRRNFVRKPTTYNLVDDN